MKVLQFAFASDAKKMNIFPIIMIPTVWFTPALTIMTPHGHGFTPWKEEKKAGDVLSENVSTEGLFWQ
jgi:hypothetical protein